MDAWKMRFLERDSLFSGAMLNFRGGKIFWVFHFPRVVFLSAVSKRNPLTPIAIGCILYEMLTGSLPFAVRTAREKWNEEKTTTKRLLESCSFQGRFCFWLPIMLRVLQERGGKKLRVRRSFSIWGSRCAPLIAVLASDLNGRSMSAKDWQSLHRFGPNWKKVPTWEEWNDKQKQCFQAPTKSTNPPWN